MCHTDLPVSAGMGGGGHEAIVLALIDTGADVEATDNIDSKPRSAAAHGIGGPGARDRGGGADHRGCRCQQGGQVWRHPADHGDAGGGTRP